MNYLRVRGEYTTSPSSYQVMEELPPRARRIHGHSLQPQRMAELPPRARRILGAGASLATSHGTTSACAENTTSKVLCTGGSWNYLRVRGEYLAAGIAPFPRKELPPRARRIRLQKGASGLMGGTTSACAENTLSRTTRSTLAWNYLRVRGEYRVLGPRGRLAMELPPRARRIRSRIPA